jgi:hypothetical protein
MDYAEGASRWSMSAGLESKVDGWSGHQSRLSYAFDYLR